MNLALLFLFYAIFVRMLRPSLEFFFFFNILIFFVMQGVPPVLPAVTIPAEAAADKRSTLVVDTSCKSSYRSVLWTKIREIPTLLSAFE